MPVPSPEPAAPREGAGPPILGMSPVPNDDIGEMQE
jgi:hypothetical protein